MFGCCNNLFSCSNRCNRCGGQNVTPLPIPVFPPQPPTPTPQPRLRGMELLLTNSAGDALQNEGVVPFTTVVSNNLQGVTYVPDSGNITIGRAGTYLINWWVALSEGDDSVATAGEDKGVAFSITVNGVTVSSAYAGGGTEQISGSSLVIIGSVPTTVRLVNESGCKVQFAEGTIGQAGMTITTVA